MKTKHKRTSPTFNLPSLAMWILLLVLVSVYFGGYVYSSVNKTKVAETKIIYGNIEEPSLFEGIIVRDEKVYSSEADGVVVRVVDDNDRVKKDDQVCSIQDADKVGSLLENLAWINKNIISIQAERQGLSIYEDEVKTANKQIIHLVDEMSFNLSEKGIQEMYSLRDRVDIVMGERNQMLLSENRGTLQDYVSIRNEYEEQLKSAKQNIFTDSSGIVSYNIDHMEDVLTVASLNTLLMEQTKQKVDYNVELPQSNTSNVKQGDSVFKIIRSNDWYIAAYIDKKLTAGWTVNMSKNIYIESKGSFFKLETSVFIIENAGDYSYVVFKSNKNMIDFLDKRNVKFKLDQDVAEGLKIPNTAIVEKTLLVIPNECIFETSGKNTVIKRVAGKDDEAVTITVSSSDDTYTYIISDYNNIRLGDVLVCEGYGSGIFQVSDVENAMGVYVINTGAAVFKKFNTGGNFAQNTTHTILDPNLNTHLKAHDNIVADVKNIEEKQLIY